MARWKTATGGFVAAVAAGVTSLYTARASLPSGTPADLHAILGWIASGNDPLALFAAGVGGVLAASSAWPLFQPGTASDKDMKAVLTKLAGLEARLASDPSVSTSVAESFRQAAGELIRSENPVDRAAVMEISEDNPIAAADRLMRELRQDNLRNAIRARQAGRIYAPFSPSKARVAYEVAVDLDPTDVWAWIELGRLRAVFGTLAEARQCVEAALQYVADERDRAVLDNAFGDLAMACGDLQEASRRYDATRSTMTRLAAEHPDDADRHRDLMLSFLKLGNVEVAAGNLVAARECYEAGLSISERLAAKEPGNMEWQRDLSVSLVKLGDVETSAGNLVAARERYEACLAIREPLAARAPGYADWQCDLSLIFDRLGNVEAKAGNLVAARERYEAGLAIRERLAAHEPDNTQWQRGLFVSYTKFAGLAEVEGYSGRAVGHLRKAEQVMTQLVEGHSDHPGFTHDLQSIRAEIERVLKKEC